MFILGDFNIDLMHYNKHKPTNKLLDSLASNSYFPHIIEPVVIPEPFWTIYSVMSSQKPFLVILQLPYLTTFHNS